MHWLSTGKTADGLVDNRLENRGGEVFSGGTFVDKRLDISFGEYTTARRNWINCLEILCVFIQTGGIGLD